jgi:hypothetical protein
MCAICNFKIDFGVGHPLALSVAVATRKAVEGGIIEPIDSAEGALSAARMRMSSVDALNLLQARIAERSRIVIASEAGLRAWLDGRFRCDEGVARIALYDRCP